MSCISPIQHSDYLPDEPAPKKEAVETLKSDRWELSYSSLFSRMQPSEEATPLFLSAMCLYYIARLSFSLLTRDIKTLRLANALEEKNISSQGIQNHTFELQKEMIYRLRKSTIYKILAKAALVSSLAYLTLAEYWNLAGTPIRNLRLYSLI